MNFLEKIVAEKHREVLRRKAIASMKILSEMPLFGRQTISFSKSIQE